MHRARVILAVTVSAVLIAVTLAASTAPQAKAMALYNNSPYYQGGVDVQFYCGFACGWFPSKGIPYQMQAAYPGKGGSFTIVQAGCTISQGTPNIESHGYAVLTGTDLNVDIDWHMWDNDGNVVSGSPFSVVCFPSGSRARSATVPRRIGRQFRAWDTSHDGFLSRREILAGVRRTFRQIDLDHDGVIAAGDIRRDLRRQGGRAARRVGKTRLVFDLNRDGHTGLSEYERYVQRTFIRPMDSSHDGRISRKEADAFYVKLLA